MPMPTRDELREQILSEARILTWFQADASGEEAAEAPELQFTDLDSFSVVQIVLSLEERHGVDFLEDLSDFSGRSFDDLAVFALERIRARGQAEDEHAS